MNTYKTLRMGALGTLVAVGVLAGCDRPDPETTSNTVVTPPTSTSPAPGTSGYVGPSGESSSSSGSDSSVMPPGGPGQSSSDQPGTSGYVGDSDSTSGAPAGSTMAPGSSETEDDMRNRSGSGTGSNPVGPNSSLDQADRPFRDVAVQGRPDVGAVWREAMGVRLIRVDTQGDARKSGSGSSGMGLTPANTDKMSKKDKKFIEKAAAGGMFEVEAARLAEQKASDPQVKSFAAKLMNHHHQANEELKQIADANGVMLPTKLPSKEQAMIDKLSKAEGAKFDQEYLKTVGLRDHKEDIRAFENAQNETGDNQLKAWIDKTLPTLRTHLAEAQSISDSPTMQGYTGSGSAAPSEASPGGKSKGGTGSATDPGSQGPAGTGVGGSLGN